MGILERIDARAARDGVGAPERHEAVVASRQVAARQVLRGGLLAAGSIGLGLLAGLGAFGASTFLVSLGAAVLGGAGLVEIGRAAKHARRYGSTGSLVALDAAAGLGLSSVGFAILYWLYSIGATPGWAVGTAMLLGLEFGVLLLMLTLRALLRWTAEPW